MNDPATVIEVFADVGCPFTHVGLRRMVDRRDELGRTDVVLRVRAWPLEHVNHTPLDPAFIAEEVAAIRVQVAPDLFTGFVPGAFPATSLPARPPRRSPCAPVGVGAGHEVGEQGVVGCRRRVQVLGCKPAATRPAK